MSLDSRQSTALNCDQVFNVLTRGPFPTGLPEDAAVERHLAACHECRELAAALEPAVQLFHEALGPAEGRELPGYRGRHRGSETAVLSPALEAAIFEDAPADSVAVVPATYVMRRDSWRLAGMLGWSSVLVLLLIVAIWQAPRNPLNGAMGKHPPLDTRAAMFQPSDAGREWLAALNLPATCFHAPAISANGLAQAESGYACCLKCHATSSANRPPLDAQATLDRTCHVCHNY